MPLQPDDAPDVTVVLVNYNTAHLLDRLFAALEASRATLKIQTIVVDNASRDGSAEILRTRFPNVELIENSTNVGFGRANNQALPLARGRHVLLLNTDAFVSPDTLVKTVRYMDEHGACGVLGVKLVGQDGSLQPSCRYFPTAWNIFLSSTGLNRLFPRARLVDDMSWDHASERECDWVPGCYYLVRRDVIEQVGLFDPRYFLYYEEIDHCRAVQRAGWRIVYYPFTAGNAHRRRKCGVRRNANPCGSAEFAASDRKRVAVFSKTLRLLWRAEDGVPVDFGGYDRLHQRPYPTVRCRAGGQRNAARVARRHEAHRNKTSNAGHPLNTRNHIPCKLSAGAPARCRLRDVLFATLRRDRC